MGKKVDRIRRVESQREKENVTDDYVTQGYEVMARGENTCKLREHGGWGSFAGHVIVFLLFGWWTLGISNLIFALYKRYSGEKVLIKLNKQELEES